MTTRGELIAYVRSQLNEPVAAAWSDTELVRWLNEANRDVARSTHFYKSTDTITVTSGVAEYTLDSNILTVEQAYYDDDSDRQFPLTPRHWESMDQVWGTRQDLEGNYPAYFTTWGVTPTMKIRLYPVPTSSTHVVRLLTSIVPADLPTSNSDTVEIPGHFWDLLADYAEFKALRKDRNPVWQEAQAEYMRKLDQLIVNQDALTVNREVVPDFRAGYVPRWLADFDDYSY